MNQKIQSIVNEITTLNALLVSEVRAGDGYRVLRILSDLERLAVFYKTQFTPSITIIDPTDDDSSDDDLVSPLDT